MKNFLDILPPEDDGRDTAGWNGLCPGCNKQADTANHEMRTLRTNQFYFRCKLCGCESTFTELETGELVLLSEYIEKNSSE